MNFDASLREQWILDGDLWSMDVPSGWMQGRSVFGGLTAAMAAALARRVVPDPSRRLRTLSIQLFAPVVPGALEGAVRVLREGRNVTFVEVRLGQGGREVAVTSAVFVGGIKTMLVAPVAPAPEMPAPETLNDLPYIPGVIPEFTQHVQMRWASGSPPFSGGDIAAYTGLFRYRCPVADAEGLLGLLDTWPCPSLSLLKGPSAASTVSWTAHLLALPEPSDGWFTMAYETVAGGGGFHTAVGRLYSPEGQLIGWTEQLVAVFG